jgi:small-conductance mechanosensitive channel
MMRKHTSVLACLAVVLAMPGVAWAQVVKSVGGSDGVAGTFLSSLTDRIEQIFASLPALGDYFARLPQQLSLGVTALLLGIVVAGLVAEWLARVLLQRARNGIFARYAGGSPLRAFLHAALLDALALLALWIAARIVAGRVGDPHGVAGQIAHQILVGLLYWRGFNFVFRIWLRPHTPEGRMAPVDDTAAARLLVGLNVVVVVPMLGRQAVTFMQTTGAEPAMIAAATLLVVPVLAASLLFAVWHWRREMAAWLGAMVRPNAAFHTIKLAMAQDWWIGGLAFYLLSGLAAMLAAVTERTGAARGITAVESMLLLLLLLETLIHRLSHHLPMEVPTVGDVVAASLRLALRLIVFVVGVDAILVVALGMMDPTEWEPHARAVRLAAISAFVFYVLWRVLKYRMDRYIADNPLPAAGFQGDADDDAPAAASRLRTIMPLIKVTTAIAILILGSLLVLSEIGVNTTPLIAGFSVLGLAVSFGSQSLVRDIVSGIFFLAEDSFRVGEYIDGAKAKGTVEGFSVRSIRLRHQNGQLNIVPFGQLTHITNFSRDWTTVKFNLAFAPNIDVELLRKTVKKIGLDMMTEPQFQKELLQPLKMQGLVDIKDGSLIVRFKFTAKPKNPSMIQRMAIRRMYESLPKLGIDFAKPSYPMMFGNPDPATRIAAQ